MLEFLTAALGLSPPAAATTFSVFGAMVSGRVLSCWLARRIDDRTLLLSTLCLATVGVLLLWLSRDPVPGLAGLFMTGLACGRLSGRAISRVSTVPSATDTAAARLGIAAGTANLAMPFAVGRLADEIGIIDSFGVVAPLLIGAILLTALDRRRAARVNEEEPGANKRVEDEDRRR